MSFKTPTNAAKRLLEAIKIIEEREMENGNDEGKKEVKMKRTNKHDCPEDIEEEVRQRVMNELLVIDTYVRDLDDKYEDLRYGYKLDL